MFKVDSFFCCMRLETGGKVLGWCCIIANVFAIIMNILLIAIIGISSCTGLVVKMDKFGYTLPEPEFQHLCAEHGKAVNFCLIVVFVIVLLFFIYCAVAGYLCIKGVTNRVSSKIKPLMILWAIYAASSLLSFFFSSAAGVVSGLFSAIFSLYFFLVLYSLFSNFKNEREAKASNLGHRQVVIIH